MALSRLEVHEAGRAELLLLLARHNQQPSLEDDHERMLVNLMIVQPLALRQGQEDHPACALVGAQHPRTVSLDRLLIQLPQFHSALHHKVRG